MFVITAVNKRVVGNGSKQLPTSLGDRLFGNIISNFFP
jgi:hypothetical protein